jgi:transposase
VLITSHDDWPAAEVIAGYQSQSEAESGFRQMKDPHVVSFSPMRHWTGHNIRELHEGSICARSVLDLYCAKRVAERACRLRELPS